MLKNTRKTIIIYLLLLSVSLFSFSKLFIINFKQPFIGYGDTNVWEYIGFYISKNLNFRPFPTLEFYSNQVFYPYGVSSVFQNWGFERDFFYVICSHFFGYFGWLQIYYLISILITSVGSFFILKKDYGVTRASSISLIITFFNFYRISKYPVHYGYAIIHWTVLSILVDFLIVKRVTLNYKISLKVILLRACLLMLSLGQELGYVTGFALTSFTISSIYILIILIFKSKLRQPNIKTVIKLYKKEIWENKIIFFILSILCIVLAYLYIPLVLQIAQEAKKYPLPLDRYWVNPLRLLIPFLPNFNPFNLPSHPDLATIFNDSPESVVENSVGWFLLIIGLGGLFNSKNKFWMYLPLIILLTLCLFYDPKNVPTLAIFPWFKFNRIPGRSTLIYSTILCIFALEFNLNYFRSVKRYIVIFILVVLGCTELYTGYFNLSKIVEKPPQLSSSFFTYMSEVKNTPGEAVLDWPFCIIGGNGVGGAEGLCPYFFQNLGTYALRRFHQKKVMGQYFGRLHPSQIEKHLSVGWNKLFFPDSADIFQAKRQNRCFKPDEWSFFTDFYKLNDFAGINLYIDLLPKDCPQEFHLRFGNPIVETTVPSIGRVQFIPKSQNLRSQVNLKQGYDLKFEPLLDLSESNFLSLSSPGSIDISGLSKIETNTQGERWRWALGPETKLTFKLSEPKFLQLSFQFINPIERQNLLVEFNNLPLEKLTNVNAGTVVKRSLKLNATKGFNSIVFKYGDWNTKRASFAPEDGRPMSISFTQLVIEPPSNK